LTQLKNNDKENVGVYR